MLFTGTGMLHSIVFYFFSILILFMIVRMVLSWVAPMMSGAEGHPIVRFFYNVTDPLIEPLARRIPRKSLGGLDLGTTVAFVFTWWALSQLDLVIRTALPVGW